MGQKLDQDGIIVIALFATFAACVIAAALFGQIPNKPPRDLEQRIERLERHVGIAE